MIRAALLLAPFAVFCGLAAATAAPPTGSRIDNSRFVEDPVAGWRYGRCVANFRTDAAEALLAAAPSSAAARDAIDRVVDRNYDRCYTEAAIGGQQLNLQETLLRGQVSQGLYLRKYPDTAPRAIAGAEASTIPVEVYNERIRDAGNQRAEVLSIFGDCVVAASPRNVDRLIRTAVTSDEEGAVIGSLAGRFGPCLWQGQSIEFSAESLRAVLAAALYRRSEGRTVLALNQGDGE